MQDIRNKNNCQWHTTLKQMAKWKELIKKLKHSYEIMLTTNKITRECGY